MSIAGGKYSKWIVILQECDLEFIKSKSNKSLVFAELLCDFPLTSIDSTSEPSILDESLFLISSSDAWYGDILIYLQTQTFQLDTSRLQQRHIHYQAKDYLIISDTFYRRGINTILQRCLTHEEAKKELNDFHLSACGGHLSGYATAQRFLCVGYFWPTIFKGCIIVVRSYHACQIYDQKARLPPKPYTN